jgi:hypothetical protein
MHPLLPLVLVSKTGSHLAAGQSQIHQLSFLPFNFCSPVLQIPLSHAFFFNLRFSHFCAFQI